MTTEMPKMQPLAAPFNSMLRCLRKSRLAQAIFISILAHTTLFLLLFHQAPLNPVTADSTLQVSLIKSPSRHPQKGPIANSRNRQTHTPLTWKQISLGLGKMSLNSHTTSRESEDTSEPLLWTNSQKYVPDQMTDFDQLSIQDIRFEKALWKEIDQSISDSPYLSEYDHTGKVHLYFEITKNGQLDDSLFRSCGADSVLKVLASRALRKALRNEHKEIPFPTKRTIFYAQFSWSDYSSCKKLKGIRQNYLSFCHYAENKRKSFSKGEKTLEYVKALNYGLGAIEEIKKYNREENRRRTKFDPFEELRRDPDWNRGC